MNRYAHLAQKAWNQSAPQRVAALEDPIAFFADLGLQMEARVDALMLAMQGQDVPGETILDKTARLNAVQQQAEELAFQELLYPAPSDTTTVESLEDGDLPSPERVQELLVQLQENESEMSTEEYEERLAHLRSLQTNRG